MHISRYKHIKVRKQIYNPLMQYKFYTMQGLLILYNLILLKNPIAFFDNATIFTQTNRKQKPSVSIITKNDQEVIIPLHTISNKNTISYKTQNYKNTKLL